MMALFVFREKLKTFYSKYEIYVTPVVRFLFGLVTFTLINENLGFMTRLANPVTAVVLALICSVLPYGAMAFFSALMILAHISSVSLELTLVTGVFLLLVAVIYYGFHPGDVYLMILTPIFFLFRIPYAIPILAGLSCGMTAAVPVACGTCLFYVLQYAKQNAGVLTGGEAVEFVQRLVRITKSITSNHTMMVMALACAIGVIVVYLIRRLSVDYAWIIAIAAGMVAQVVAIFVGDFMFNVSVAMTELLLGSVASVVLAGIYHFFVFSVDYSRTEYVQFEDDDYYYYVKAVPKIAVSAPDVKVQKINTSRARRSPRERQEHRER